MAFDQLKKRIIRRKMAAETRRSGSVTVDGILWDVLIDSKCRVKILGSETLITAKYSQAQNETPAWIVPGAPVKLSRVSGVTGDWVIVGAGSSIPEPVGGALLPPMAEGVDGIFYGLEVLPFLVPTMAVFITPGVFRLVGQTYTVASGTMGGPLTYLTMKSGVKFGAGMLFGSGGTPYEEGVAGSLVVESAHGSLPRFDSVCINSSKVFSVVKGTASEEPSPPATPSGNLVIAAILVLPAATEITYANIGRTHTPPFPAVLSISATVTQLADGVNTSTITATVKDQYGLSYAGHMQIKATIDKGSGTIDDNATSPVVVKSTTTNLGFPTESTTFLYTRSLSSESSPIIYFYLIGDDSVMNCLPLILEDSNGIPIP